jgi:hypothetical protein
MSKLLGGMKRGVASKGDAPRGAKARNRMEEIHPKTLAHDPRLDAAHRYAGWTVKLVPLTGMDYQFRRQSQEIWLDPDAYAEDPEYTMAILRGHLFLGHLDDDEPMFTAEQVDFADTFAEIGLDRAGSR